MTSGEPDQTRPTVHLRVGAERLTEGTGDTFDHIHPATSAAPVSGKEGGPEGLQEFQRIKTVGIT